MGRTIVVKLDEKLAELLETKAELHGLTLEEQVHDILSQAATLSPDERGKLIDYFHSLARVPQQTDSVELLREGREQR